MQTKIQNFCQRFEIKTDTDGEQGTFVAYGNVFNVVDNFNDVTIHGAFAASIKRHLDNGTMPKLLAQHGHTTMPIGIITSMSEDEKGLRFEGKFALSTQAGQEAYDLIKMGAIDEFSIGYMVLQKEQQIFNGQSVRALIELDVKEISLVTFACNDQSKIESIKSAIINDENVTQRMVQKALQESGLSKRQAESAVNQIKSDPVVEEEIMSKNQSDVKAPRGRIDPVEQKSEENSEQPAEKLEHKDSEVVGMERKACYWMRQTLSDPVLSLDCVREVLGFLPPSAHQKIIDAAEEGRKIQKAALDAADSEEGEKSDSPVEEVKSEEVKSEDEVKSKDEVKSEDEVKSDENAIETKDTKVTDEPVLTIEDITGWFAE